MGNKMDKVAGHSKELLGKVTGNKAQELRGKTQHELADAKDKAKGITQKLKDEL